MHSNDLKCKLKYMQYNQIVGEGATYGIECIGGDVAGPGLLNAMKPNGKL